MLHSYIVDQLLDQHRFSYTGTTKQTDLSSLWIGLQEIDDLDPCFQNIDYRPLLFDEVAWNFPRLKFSMEHVGGYHFFREALAVICNNHHRASDPRRVYAGLTSIMPDDNGLPDYWTLTDDELLTLIHQGDDDCAIFGLDFPYKKADYAKALINRIIALDISEEAKEGILGKNLEHALGMD